MGRGSFFGDLAYDRVLERYQDHFLVVLEKLFDWDAVSEQLIRLYKGRGETGRPPYRPALAFKLLFLSYLYNVSERSIVELADLHLLMKWFLGLAIDERPPVHSTLTVFKGRFLPGQNWKVLEGMFDDIIVQAQAYGLQLGELQVLDSVHTQADVNNDRDRKRQEQGKEPRDPDARVVNKGKRKVTQADGSTETQNIRYRGYKAHASVNAETGLVTTVVATHGKHADSTAFPQVREHDRALNLPTQAYGGDKAYDDTDIYERLAVEGLDIAVTLNDYRTAKNDAIHARRVELVADPLYQERKGQRFRVEQPFGIGKRWRGFERCRYLGLARYRIQALFTFIVLNAKRLARNLVSQGPHRRPKGGRQPPFAGSAEHNVQTARSGQHVQTKLPVIRHPQPG
jgi:IS5 family transposase